MLMLLLLPLLPLPGAFSRPPSQAVAVRHSGPISRPWREAEQRSLIEEELIEEEGGGGAAVLLLLPPP
jgi:hypothetical protein